MTRRKLTQDEIDLWKQVAETTRRLHPDTSQTDRPVVLPKPIPKKAAMAPAARRAVAAEKRPKNEGYAKAPGMNGHSARSGALKMDQKAFGRMKRGKLKPEARLDLHGMRLEAAHTTLKNFILSSQASGKRLVLVITGKGKDRDEAGPIPTPRGILRHQVPQWLRIPPMAQSVLEVAPAHISHGGDGAFYVYLRRSR